MSSIHDEPVSDAAARPLGRIPSGLFILTARHEGHSTGMLASWVMQAGFEPPMVTFALARGRFVGDWIEAAGRCTLNQVPSDGKALLKHFGRGFAPDENAFDGLELLDVAAAGPVPAASSSFLDLEVVGRLDEGDHLVYLARVVGAGVIRDDAEPYVHIRSNGFRY